MILTEMKKTARSIPTYIFLLFMIAVACLEVYLNVKPFVLVPFIEQKMLLSSNPEGHVSAILLLWIFPLYVFFVSGERLIRERVNNTYLLEATRHSRNKQLAAKILAPALFFALVYLCTFALNALLTVLILRPDAVPFSRADAARTLEVIKPLRGIGLGVWMYEHAALTYILYAFSTALILFTMTALIGALAVCFPNRKVVYPLCLIYWLIGWMTRFNLDMCVQPFTEYGLSYMLAALAFFLIYMTVPMIILIGKVRRFDYL